jgi:protocatechuate 3,4-dioxygenase beta subunit
MDNDDHQTGKIFTRREALTVLGTGALAFLAACGRLPQTLPATLAPAATATGLPAAQVPVVTQAAATSLPACIVRPELTEGPYFVDETLDRSDIRSDPATGAVKEGVLLNLAFRLSQVGAQACAPLPGAMVDVWHCDALGVYSGVSDSRGNTVGQTYLRGYQVSDENGLARFTTIYPGWYPGRTVHIHFKIRLPAASGSFYDFTSQLFFDDGLTDEIFSNQPYAGQGERNTRNADDSIFRSSGDQLTLSLAPLDTGYAAIFDIGLQVD